MPTWCLPRIQLMMLLAAATILTWLVPVSGHGRLMDPPARNSMWRLGFQNPVNYNDNELYCGGRGTQWARNKGKCGVCGDPYHNEVKDHEVGGKFANGIISREYTQGDTIEVIVHITANHKGYFEFRICPVEDPKVEVTQECLDTHVMAIPHGEGSRYFLPEGKSNQFFNVSVQLPQDIVCKQCVIQWKYRTGNTWDKDESGKSCIGCGPQEEFYNCADVTVHPKGTKVKGQQARNAKPVIQNDERDSTHKMGSFGKAEVPDVDNKRNSLKTTAVDTISDYGKQKVDFMGKFENNEYSYWSDSKNSVVTATKGSPFAHLARADIHGSERNTSNTLRFGYIGNGYQQHQRAMSRAQLGQSSPTVYRPETGISGKSDGDKIRRRFGYSNAVRLQNHTYISFPGNTTYGFDHVTTTSTPAMTGGSRKVPASPQVTHSHGYRITVTPSRADTHSVNANPETKHVSDVHKSLLEIIKDTRRHPKESDNFLRKLKLQKLKRIAEMRALRSMQTSNSNTAKLGRSPFTRYSVTYPAGRTNPLQHSSSSISTGNATRPPLVESNFVQQRTGSNIYSSLTDRNRKLSTSEFRNKNSYARSHLPTWLLAALKDEDSKLGNRFNEDKKYRHFIKTSSNSVTAGDASNELHKSLLRSRQPDFSGDYGQIPAYKINNNAFGNIQRQQMALHEKVDDLSNIQRYSRKSSVDKQIEVAASELPIKNIQDEENTDTEALVKHILALLVSKIKNNELSKNMGELKTQNTSLPGGRKLSVGSPVYKSVIDTPAPGHSWLVQSRVSAPTSKHRQANSRTEEEGITSQSGSESRISTELQGSLSVRTPADLPPTVRGKVSAFNGLILGSDSTYNRNGERNVAAKYPNRRTAGSFHKKHLVNSEEVSKQNDTSRDTNHIATSGLSNDFYSNKHHRRNNNMQIGNKRQVNKMWKQPTDMISPATTSNPHLWSMRATKRQQYYNKHPSSYPRSQLVCESVAVLNGGMDRWCMDNCNANFCPSSLCICTIKELGSSPKLLQVPVTIPRQNNKTLARQHTRSVKSQAPNGVQIPLNIHSYVTVPRDTDYISSSQLYSLAPKEKSNNNLSRNFGTTKTPAINNMLFSGHRTNKNKMDLFLQNVISQDSHLLQSPTDSNYSPYSPRSTQAVTNYPVLSTDALEHRKIQNGVISRHFDTNQIKANHPEMPQTTGTVIYNRVVPLEQVPELSQKLNWYTNSNNYNVRQNNNWLRSRGSNRDRTQATLPLHRSYNTLLHHAIPGYNTLIHNKSGHTSKPAGQNHFRQEKLSFSQMPELQFDSSQRETDRDLVCQALGAFAGGREFDEWCVSTCMTTVCPLTLCSCEKLSSAGHGHLN